MSVNMIGLSFIILGILLLIGKLIRIKSTIFQKYFIPSSIIGGLLGLLLGPEILGKIISLWKETHVFANGLFPHEIIELWGILPSIFINIIFASLFLGQKIPNIKDIWLTAGPQVSFGQTVAWGQYVVGILLAITILSPLFGMNPMAGALIEISFEGGHGTAAGLGSTFEELGFSEGQDLAIGLATIGVISAVVIGIIIINWGIRRSKTDTLNNPSEMSLENLKGINDKDDRPVAGRLTTSPESIEPLTFHFALIGIAILLGYGLLQGLIYIEEITYANWSEVEIMSHIPLFPLAMIGGVILQKLADRFDNYKLIDRELIKRIQGFALDFLIVSAISTLSISIIGTHLIPFLLLAVAGIAWNILAFVYLAPKMIPRFWFERGIGDFGQSMGMTAAGLMLIRITDSKNKTKAFEAFGYKQLLFEPIVGGGLFTAASVPLIYQFGPLPILILSFILMVIWLLVGFLYFGKKE
ncbi:sodium/glutamate symporter [Litchfieldia alkalitelluris]|uniref:sodium/glutamate symporter n=1 Tax=Litchfieldia alkalitelluris TaxID=304268 RepID=UPI0009981CDA|nr:sodium/glutamate symporter [Litchfieldia alkalitelluris]